jgi:type I restriction enzyme M protein
MVGTTGLEPATSTVSILKRLDEREVAEELKANREKKQMQKRFFPEGKENKKRPFQDYRWSRFKNTDPRDMYTVVSEHVFPWLRTLGGNGTTYSKHMEGARFTIPSAALLAKVVDRIDKVPMEDRDTKGDLYEYCFSSVGRTGNFSDIGTCSIWRNSCPWELKRRFHRGFGSSRRPLQ